MGWAKPLAMVTGIAKVPWETSLLIAANCAAPGAATNCVAIGMPRECLIGMVFNGTVGTGVGLTLGLTLVTVTMALCCCFCLFSNVLANSWVTGVRVSRELEVVAVAGAEDTCSGRAGTGGLVNREFPCMGDIKCC